MDYRIGCSGYYYPQWKNKLYPKGVAPKNWLAFYSNVFNTVELNGTFYRTPKLTDLKKYAAVTNDNFTFSVKMSRYITHVQRLSDKQTIVDFQQLLFEGLEHKLQRFLFQLPPSFKYSEENLATVVDNIPNAPQNVVEFRHASWWNDQVKEALTSANITFCNVDFPGLDSWFIHTSQFFYLRLHGNPELFKTPYTESRLEYFHSLFPSGADVISVYFNNTITEAGFQNALQLRGIIENDIVVK
jgi:uncharacterized protein YecE (DUF72 family)